MQEKTKEYLEKYKQIVSVDSDDIQTKNMYMFNIKINIFLGMLNFLFFMEKQNMFFIIVILFHLIMVLYHKHLLNNSIKLYKHKIDYDILKSFKNCKKMMLTHKLNIKEIKFLEDFFIKNIDKPFYGIRNLKKECEKYLIR